MSGEILIDIIIDSPLEIRSIIITFVHIPRLDDSLLDLHFTATGTLQSSLIDITMIENSICQGKGSAAMRT